MAQAHAAWQGTLTFGLVSIPIRIYPAARTKRIELHEIDKKDHARLKRPLVSPTTNRIVDRSEVVKGYEYEKGKYAVIDDEEVKKLEPHSGRAMEILAFVPADQVDPIYFDSSFLCLPQAEGRKGYQLLVKALEQTSMIGVAKFDMHQREYTVFIRPRAGGLTLHTMYYANEITQIAEYGKDEAGKLAPQEVKLAEQLVKSLVEDFKPERYHDEYQDRLKALVESKLHGRKMIAEAPAPGRAKVINIMDALKQSLAETDKRKLAPAGAARRHKQKAAG